MSAQAGGLSTGPKRSRTGCVNCRRKKKKCDEVKPTCFNCVKTFKSCKWGRPLSFLPQNAFTISEDSTSTNLTDFAKLQGSTVKGRSLTTQRYDISDSPEHEFDSHFSNHVRNHESDNRRYVPTTPVAAAVQPVADHLTSYQTHASSRPQSITPTTSNVPPTDREVLPNSAYTARFHEMSEQLLPHLGLSAEMQNTVYFFDPSHDVNMAHAGTSPDLQQSPDMVTDDGIFMPGSTYQELHSTLRRHVFTTARSQEPSRYASPVQEMNGPQAVGNLISHSDLNNPAQTRTSESDASEAELHNILDPVLEARLWKNWVTEIGDWLDKFDTDCCFKRMLPVLANKCPHLRYSMLALSARQLERKDKSVSASVTLSLYSTAVHLLLPQLHHRDTNVLASCVVICVLEMMSCSPKAWRRHLDGCASLIRSMNIYGDSDGVEGALFWCFARMDVCGGLISKERTLIPINAWTSQQSLKQAVEIFLSRPTVDWSARHASFLLACAIDLLFAPSTAQADPSPATNTSREDLQVERWRDLFSMIEDWYDNRPSQMLPLVTPGMIGTLPFPTLLFSNSAAISGNQLHHTAAMLMLQNVPRHVKHRPKHSILWHARRICGISTSNDHHGCWTNSVQPLWLAGQVMSHPTEHKAIVDIYARIEKETGWGASWRADDLRLLSWADME